MAYVKKSFHLIYPTTFTIPQNINMNRKSWFMRIGVGRKGKENGHILSSLKFFKACKFTGTIKSKYYTSQKDYIESIFHNGDMIKKITVRFTPKYESKINKGILKHDENTYETYIPQKIQDQKI